MIILWMKLLVDTKKNVETNGWRQLGWIELGWIKLGCTKLVSIQNSSDITPFSPCDEFISPIFPKLSKLHRNLPYAIKKYIIYFSVKAQLCGILFIHFYNLYYVCNNCSCLAPCLHSFLVPPRECKHLHLFFRKTIGFSSLIHQIHGKNLRAYKVGKVYLCCRRREPQCVVIHDLKRLCDTSE